MLNREKKFDRFVSPSLYSENEEIFEIANAIRPELDSLSALAEKHFKNSFVITSNLQGVQEWERILEIRANPLKEDLPFRRDRIIARLSLLIPFTERFMVEMIDNIIGEGKWSYYLDYNNYRLVIQAKYPMRNWIIELEKLFKIILPCNIILEADLYRAIWHYVKHWFEDWGDIRDNKAWTWQEVMELTPPYNMPTWRFIRDEMGVWSKVKENIWEYLVDLFLNEEEYRLEQV